MPNNLHRVGNSPIRLVYLFTTVLVTVILVIIAMFVLGGQAPNVKACITGLLAAIPLLDGLILASVQAVLPSLACLLVFVLIPRLYLVIVQKLTSL